MPSTAYAGKAASITYNSNAQQGTNWTLDLKVDDLDISNYTSGGYVENIAGFQSAEVSFDLVYGGTVGLSQGASASVTFAAGGGGPSFAVTLRVKSIKFNDPVKGFLTATYTCISNGSFSISP